MSLKGLYSNKKRNLLFLSLFLGFSLLLGCFMGISAPNAAPEALPAPLDQDVVLSSNQVIEANISREWDPIVLTLQDLPILSGLTALQIRVVYYDSDMAEWLSVPFQIDEKGWYPLSSKWQDGTMTNNPPIPDPNPYGYIGPDSDGMDGFTEQEADELVFYLHHGARVTPTMWWEGDADGTYAERIELSIRDPVDGGVSWAYIYYDPFQIHLDFDWPLFYPVQGWNSSQMTAYGEYFYSVTKDIFNPNLETDIRGYSLGDLDFVDESMKSYSSLIFDIMGLNFTAITNREGSWNRIPYSDRKTELNHPETIIPGPQPTGYDIEGGSGVPIVSGPIRTILNKRIFTNVTIPGIPEYISVMEHETEFFYMDRKHIIVNKSVPIPSIPGLSAIYVDFDYSMVTSLNTSTRTNFLVYEGWVQDIAMGGEEM
ncbi:MAG: hypothetical protein ACFFD2_23410, partial [Promethearchaeota archaeon]